MKVGIAGIHLETAAFNPIETRRDAFHVSLGFDMLRCVELPEIDAVAGIEFAPLYYARARPGGAVSQATFVELLEGLIARLHRIGPLDGLLLAQHGGLRAEGVADAEAAIVLACRQVLRPNVPIVATYDPHGDPGEKAISALDGACAYWTAPHVDIGATRRRALSLLRHVIVEPRGQAVRTWQTPLSLVGSMAEGESGAAGDTFRDVAQVAERVGVIDASVLMGSPWLEGRPNVLTHLVIATSMVVADRSVRELGAAAWERRAAYRHRYPVVDSISDLQKVVHHAGSASTRGPVWLLDAGDAVGAGGVGDRFDLTLALIDADLRDGLVTGIVAPRLLERCVEAGEGTFFETTVGPELAPSSIPAGVKRTVGVTVRRILPHASVREKVNCAGLGHGRSRQVLLDVEGMCLLIGEFRRSIDDSDEMIADGIDPQRYAFVAVKSTRPPAGVGARSPVLLVSTMGATDHDLGRLVQSV
ncbi:MAG: M81 family metallopeptidase [Trueperaceae bacterium]